MREKKRSYPGSNRGYGNNFFRIPCDNRYTIEPFEGMGVKRNHTLPAFQSPSLRPGSQPLQQTIPPWLTRGGRLRSYMMGAEMGTLISIHP